MKRGRTFVVAALALTLVLVLGAVACSTTAWQARLWQPDAGPVDDDAPFLKAHTRHGDVYVMSAWRADEGKRVVTGTGIHYDGDRNVISRGKIALSYDDVALFETNRPGTVIHTGLIVMGVMSGASLALSALCLSNPKACFGSCPTFYASDGDKPVLMAEGFSDAIAPSLENTDVDALYRAKTGAGPFEIEMTNEALETHAVNSVRLLAVPRGKGSRVFHARSGFYAATQVVAPQSCTSSSTGDCLAATAAADAVEYHSLTDEHDLATKETVELVFHRPASGAHLGVVVGARNSLLNTFLFYQTLAYAGRTAGDWLMRLEQGGERAKEMFGAQGKILGDIDVTVLATSGRWVPAGEFREVGPIAKEVQLVTLPNDTGADGGDVHVRLSMTRGNWRVDFVALAALGDVVTPVALTPTHVKRDGVDDDKALAELLDPKGYLVTYPGDAYAMTFDVPEGDPELFLESRGYYLEWIREQWLPEQNNAELVGLFLSPDDAMKKMAPAFKKLEPSMEQVFWESKFGGPR